MHSIKFMKYTDGRCEQHRKQMRPVQLFWLDYLVGPPSAAVLAARGSGAASADFLRSTRTALLKGSTLNRQNSPLFALSLLLLLPGPAQGFFLKKGVFSCYCCLFGGVRLWVFCNGMSEVSPRGPRLSRVFHLPDFPPRGREASGVPGERVVYLVVRKTGWIRALEGWVPTLLHLTCNRFDINRAEWFNSMIVYVCLGHVWAVQP